MDEKTIKVNPVFHGRLIDLEVLDVELDSGRKARREIVRHPGAVGVVCRLDDDRFVFVRQFRKPVETELIEIVAGTRDPNEDPEKCAVRETAEETGYSIRRITHLGTTVTAPGFCDERMDLFLADLEQEQGRQSPDEDENLDVLVLERTVVESMIMSGELRDLKSLAAWLLFKKKGDTS